MKKTAILLLSILCFLTSHSNETSSKEVDSLIAALGLKEWVEESRVHHTALIKSGMLKSPLRASIPPNLHGEFDALINDAIDEVSNQLKWDQTLPDLRKYFIKNYTIDEMKELSSFFESEAGRKYLANLQKQADELSAITQQRLAILRPELEKRLLAWNEAHRVEIENYRKETEK